MNSKQLAIYDFILSTSNDYPNIINEQILEIINEYLNDDTFTLEEIKKIIKTKFDKIECVITNKQNNIYSKYMIISPQLLLNYLIKNFDYGFTYKTKDRVLKVPLDDDNKFITSNKLAVYKDSRITNLLKEKYKSLPDFLKVTDDSLGTQLKLASRYLFYKNWILEYNKNNLNKAIGCLPDLIELEADFFDEQKIKYQRYAIVSKHDPTKIHSFIAYTENDKWYYFEYILKPFRGIHEFETQEELETTVFGKYLQLNIINPNDTYTYIKDYTDNQKKIDDISKDYKNKALYNFKMGIEYSDDLEDYKLSQDLIKDGFNDWTKYQEYLDKLPNTYDFYELKKIGKPKSGMNYFEYYEWINYQTSFNSNSKAIEDAITIFNHQKELYKLVCDNTLFPGILTKNEEYFEFSPIQIPSNIKIMDSDTRVQEITKILNKCIFNLAFGSYSIGRSVFTVNSNLTFNQYKGVDPMITPEELNYSRIVRYRNIIGTSTTPYTLQLIEKDENTFLRFRGICYLDELQKEKKISRELQEFGFYSPKIKSVNLLPQEALDKYKLPKLDEFFEDYLERTNNTKILTSREAINFSKENDKGFRIGQEIKELDNIFRITDLEIALSTKDILKISDLLNYSTNINKYPNIQTYVISFAKIMGKQMSVLLNNGYYNYDGNRRQDITLSGEICDNKFVNYKNATSKLKESIDKLSKILPTKPSKQEKKLNLEHQLNSENLKYYFQFFTFASSLKILLDCYELSCHKHIEIPVIKVFIGSILTNLTDSKKEEIKNYYLSLNNYNEIFNQAMSIDEHYNDISDSMKHFFHLILSNTIEAMNNQEKSINDAETILFEQDFINKTMQMTKEDRFVAYLKRIIREKQLDISNSLLIDNIYDGNRMGLLIKKDQIYSTSLEELVKYKIQSSEEFYKLAKFLVQEKYIKDPILLNKIKLAKESYNKKDNDYNTIIFNDKNEIMKYEPINKLNYATSGSANIVFLMLLVSGSSCVVLGIILSFIK